jgi:hypothetical protein
MRRKEESEHLCVGSPSSFSMRLPEAGCTFQLKVNCIFETVIEIYMLSSGIP